MATKKVAKPRILKEMPDVGTQLTRTYKGKTYKAAIVKSSELPKGKGVLLNGVLYPSLTGSARSITHTSVNGWTFWKLT